jgi:hypothetical protein
MPNTANVTPPINIKIKLDCRAVTVRDPYFLQSFALIRSVDALLHLQMTDFDTY